MTQGSNELNMLLKAKVVKIKVELDIKGSGLIGQVNNITKFLKDKRVKLRVELETTGLATEVQKLNTHLKDKRIKLGVELKYNAKDINKQINQIATTIKQSKTGLSDLKIGVSIDVKGTASKIKGQLAEINRVVQEFNKNYAKQIKDMQAQTDKAGKQSLSNKNTAPILASADSYAKSLLDAKAYMKTNFGKGLFATTELKDANGVLNGFVASLTKANGVVQKIRYQWDANSKTFTPINRQTITETEKHVHKAKQMLSGLYVDIERLKNSQGKTNLANEYESMMKNNNLSMDAVKILQRRIKEEALLNQQIKQQNADYVQQQALLRQIKNAMNADWKNTMNRDRRTDYKDIIKSIKNDSSQENLKLQALRLKEINDLVDKENKLKREGIANDKKKAQILEQVRKIEQQTVSSDKTSQRLIQEIRLMTQRARIGEDWLAINKKMNNLKASNNNNEQLQKSIKLQFQLEQSLRRLAELGKITGTQLDRALGQIPITATRGVADLERQFGVLNMKLQRTQAEMARVATQSKTILGAGSTKGLDVKKMIGNGDIEGLQKYLSQLYKGKVETVDMKDKTDRLGRAVTELKVKMQGTGKSVEVYTLQMRHANAELVQTAKGMTYNANRNLGVMEQLKVAMARVPTWMVAMTAFYGTLNSIKSMTNEVLKLDKSLTDLRRVASDSISIDTVFEGAIGLSKELGNNIHDVMDAVVDLSRTFGDFNERQLLDIAKTAILMSNVSDLTASDATSTLVGTMNAFNITASESIRIVDALNEVDNDYAISTQQLATGLQKSASTARTFGVSLEENVGHITAIGSVTMESGNIIGNSLKTIYSRITTMDGAREVLQGVGVELTDLQGDTRDVADIIEDLGTRWFTLSKAQQQNIAVTVAGRYQLSRFLALMNNYEVAQKAITTATYSEGSAMRENAEYLKSFEARINSLKNTWTEFASAFGKAILSDGLMSAIGLLGKLAEAGIWVMNTFGAMPVVLGAVGVALLGFGVFKKLVADIILFQVTFTRAMTVHNVRTQQAEGRAYALATAWRAVNASQVGVAASARAIGGAWKSILISTGIGVAFVALGFAIEKIVGKISEQKRAQEELDKLNKKMIDTYRSQRDGMDGLMQRYDELTNKTRLTSKEQEELSRIQKEFAEGLPTTVDYIDANGEAHLKNTEEIKKEIKAVKELSMANAKMEQMNFSETLEKQAKSYEKVAEKIEKNRNKIKELEESDGTLSRKYLGHGDYQESIVDNTKKIQEAKVKDLTLQAEQTENLKEQIKVLQTQTLAYFEANGMMDALGDSQQVVVENFMSQNEAILRFSDDFTKSFKAMHEMGKQVGGVFVQAYDEMIKNIDPENTFKITEVKTQLDSIAKTVPKSFLSLTDEQGRVVKTSKDVTDGLKEIVNVSNEVGNAGAESTDEFIYRLMKAGLTAEQAQGYLFRLATQQDNLNIKSKLATQGIDAQTGAIEDLNEAVIDALDLTESLFGYGNSDIEGMKSHLQLMHILVDKMGEGAKNTNKYKESQQELSSFLNISTTELEKNKDKIYNVLDAMSNLNLSDYGLSDSWEKFINESDLAPDQKKLMLEWDVAKDIVVGGMSHIQKVVEEGTEETKSSFETIFKDAKTEMPDIDVTKFKTSYAYVEQIAGDTEGNIQKLLDKAGEFGLTFGEPTGIALFDELFNTLETVDGEIAMTETNIDKLRLIIASAIQNPQLLEVFKSSLEETDGKLEITKGKVIDLKGELTASEGGAPFINGAKEDIDSAKDSVVDLKNETDTLNSTFGNVFSNRIQLPTGEFKNLDGTLVNIGNTAVASSQKAVTAGSEVAKVSEDINVVITQIDSAQEHLSDLNSTLFTIGDGFTTGAIRQELENLIASIKQTSTDIGSIKTNFELLSQINFGGLLEYSGALSQVYNTLALSSTYVEPARQSLEGLVTSLSQIATTSNAHVTGLSNLSANIGKVYSTLSESVTTATTTIIAQYSNNAKELTSLVEKTKTGTSVIGSKFGTLSTTVRVRFASMSSTMNAEFEKGIVQLVAKAKSMPLRMAQAIRSNIGSVTKAVQEMSNSVSSVKVQTSVPTYKFNAQGLLTGATMSSGGESDASAISTFGALSGEGGTTGGSDSGTSGVLTGSYNLGGGYDFYSLATTKANKEYDSEELAELFKINYNERTIKGWEHNINMLEARMARLSETSEKYRKTLQEIVKSENKRSAVISAEIRRIEAENAQIQKRLKVLSNVSKHTKEQREEYNKLQQDFESNTDKLHSYKVEIENIITTIAEKSEEMFSSIINEITEYWDNSINAIKKRIDDIDFELDVLELTDPDNAIAKVELMAKKVRDLTKEQNNYVNAQKELSEKIREATAKHGATSDVVKNLVSQMEDYKEAWEDITLEILRTEKEIKELRQEIADGLIDSFKKHYESIEKSSTKAKDVEIENAKKAHDAKMKMYDQESKRISEIYDQRIKELDDAYDKETYEEELEERTKEVQELGSKVTMYSGDTSLEGKKRLAEAQKELEEKQKELNDFMKKHHLDSLKEQLQEEKDLQLEKIDQQKEIDEEAHNTYIEQLQAERDAISEHYNSVVEDEKKWAKIREELMKGNFKVVNELLQDMGINLEQLSDGTFNTLSEGFDSYSQEVRDFVLEINNMINQINSMTKGAYGSISVPSNPSVSVSEPLQSYTVSALIQKAYSGEKLMSPTADKEQLYDMIQSSGISEYRMNEIWRKAQAGIALDIPSPEHMTFYNMFEQILKTNKLKKFDTGGYTGDNVPKSGGLAILDNKELVLNDKQTSHILDAVKLLDKVKSLVPEVVRNNMAGEFATAGTLNNTTNYNLTVNIDKLNGDKSGATTVVKEIMKNFKKMGK